MKRILLIVATGVLMTGSVLAQQAGPMPGMEMKGMDAKGMDMKMLMPDTSDALATKSYKLAMMKAMQTMPDFSGDADVDFMKHMRPHHQAAVDMAKVVLANGKDPDVKALAEPVLAHRLVVTPEAQLQGISPADALREVLATIPVPTAAGQA